MDVPPITFATPSAAPLPAPQMPPPPMMSSSSSMPQQSPGSSLPSYVSANPLLSHMQTPCLIFSGRGSNYVTWSAAFCRFLQIHQHEYLLIDDPPSLHDPRYVDWVTGDRTSTTWLLKMLSPDLANSLQLIHPIKKIWDELYRMYSPKSNIASRIKIFEKMFKLQGTEGHIDTVYASLHGCNTRLQVYQPYAMDISEQNRYHEEFLVSLFLNSIPTALSAQIRGSILGGTTLPSLADVFNAAQRVESLTPAKTSSSTLTPSESSVLLTSETSILLASDRGSSSRSHSSNDREKRCSKYTDPPCIHCSRSAHSSARCYQKWGYPLGHPHHVPSTSTVPQLPTISLGLLPSPSANMITLSQANYDCLSQGRSSVAHAQRPVGVLSQGPGTALLASSTSTWIIDSGASNHMSGSDSLLSRISKLPKPKNVFIADG